MTRVLKRPQKVATGQEDGRQGYVLRDQKQHTDPFLLSVIVPSGTFTNKHYLKTFHWHEGM